MPEQNQQSPPPAPFNYPHIHIRGRNVITDADQFAESAKLEKLIMKNLLGYAREEK